MKTCPVCTITKEAHEFNKNLNKSDGLQGKCRECQKKYYKHYYDSNPEERKRVLEKNNNQKKNKREMLNEKKNVPCHDCGIKYPPYIMDFDHINEKSFTISKDFNSVSMERLVKEIEKCQVVCANCHRARTYKRQ